MTDDLQQLFDGTELLVDDRLGCLVEVAAVLAADQIGCIPIPPNRDRARGFRTRPRSRRWARLGSLLTDEHASFCVASHRSKPKDA